MEELGLFSCAKENPYQTFKKLEKPIMTVENAVSMKPEIDVWDPMHEAFTSGKKYEEGPGADLELSGGSNQIQGSKIILKKLPDCITEIGIRNMCLTAGQPISVVITQNGGCAFVTFKTRKEAELAIRDLNGTPPYFLKAVFSWDKENEKGYKNGSKDKVGAGQETEWACDSFYKCSPLDKRHLSEKLSGKKARKVSPYFSIYSEYDNPSLVMRQRNLDFKTKKECVSMGRGYINIGDVDLYKCENHMFSYKSDNCNVSDSRIINCANCGGITFEKYEENRDNYCSSQCETEAESKTATNTKSKIFDFFKPGDCGSLYFLKETQEDPIKCCIALDKEAEKYKRLVDTEPEDVVSADKGDSVMVRHPNKQFLRGVVHGKERDYYAIMLTDYAEVISVRYVYSLPEDLQDIPSFGGIAWFLSDTPPKTQPIRFRVKERKVVGSWICDVIDNNNVVGEVLLEESCAPDTLHSVPLDNGCTVVITAFVDMKTVFVRRTDIPWEEDFVQFSNDLARYALQAKNYKKLPKLGEVCSAVYKNDGCFYRAVVRSVRRESVRVAFVDYGNEQETDLCDLRYLPNVLRNYNCFASRVRLKNVPETSSPESVQYFNRLTAYGTELRLTFDDGEAVLTVEATGDVVNDVVADMMVPVWQKDSSVFIKSGETHFLDSIGELSFHPGEIKDVFLLNLDLNEFSTSGTFWATQNRTEFLGHLNGELKQMITEYCDCLADDPYLPRKGELCLVQSEGDWYRGVSLEDRTSPYKVFLIDIGKSVSVGTESMRKILKEFLEMPALALECRISEFDQLDEENRRKVTEYMKKMNKKCIKDVKITRKMADVYEMSLTFVQKLLGL